MNINVLMCDQHFQILVKLILHIIIKRHTRVEGVEFKKKSSEEKLYGVLKKRVSRSENSKFGKIYLRLF